MSKQPHYFTEKRSVEGKIGIWASPTSKYEREADSKLGPFKYKLLTSDPYENGSVKICEHEVSLIMPSGIDLLAKTIETLRQRQKDVMATAHRQQLDYQEQINSLLMLTYNPDPISGEVIKSEIVEVSVSEDAVFVEINESERFGEMYPDDIPF